MYINNPNAPVVAANISEFGGDAVATGVGESGAGIPRVTVAIDSNVAPLFVTGSALSVTAGGTTNYTPNADAVMVFLSNTHATIPVYVRDQAATTQEVGILLNPGAVLAIPTVAALKVTNNGASTVSVTVNELRKS